MNFSFWIESLSTNVGLKVYKRAEKEGKLTARVSLGVWIDPKEDDQAQISRLKSLFKSKGMLRINQIRMEMDGILNHTTAALLDPYNTDYNLTRDGKNSGMVHFSQDRIKTFAKSLQNLIKFEGGFDVDLVCSGDRAVQEALDALESVANDEDQRNRISNFELISEDDIERFQKIGCIAVAQVC